MILNIVCDGVVILLALDRCVSHLLHDALVIPTLGPMIIDHTIVVGLVFFGVLFEIILWLWLFFCLFKLFLIIDFNCGLSLILFLQSVIKRWFWFVVF